ncbi:hypothetical protein [Gluconacetobacter takamatsuzukensis]|uniref:Lipoprotein n=1 Tax=Gluconacetobacter takamatsuzukensis TaxID=1286190 RepID=A0A7W4KB08_9PROT|nr:hypothetical protein [Gluconacetobacter takamatsuzukensis]MBB2203624.1 hypothetical protein [Gluconacetobacter takamatsuzukensis]
MRAVIPLLFVASLMLAGCVQRRPGGIIASSDVSVSAATNDHFVRDFAVAAGQPGIVNTWFVLNPDCSASGQVTVRVQDTPAHGTVTIEPGAYYPHYGAGNQRRACNLQPRQGVRAIYHPVPGALGTDRFSMLIVTPLGRSWTSDIHVSIR